MAKLWDVETGQERATLSGHQAEIVALHFTNDGNLLATGSFDNDVRLWDARTGQCVHTLSGHSAEVRFQARAALLRTGRAAELCIAAAGQQLHVQLPGRPADLGQHR